MKRLKNLYQSLLSIRTLISVLLITLSGWMFYYYYFQVPVEDTGDTAFYEQLDLRELKLTESSLKQVVTGGSGTNFQKMAVRAAFLRFILDPSPGGSFERFMDSYQHGAWLIPPTASWERAFREHIGLWEEKQKKLKAAGDTALRPNVGYDQLGRLIIWYPETITPLIGKSMEILISVPPEATFEQPAQYTFNMEGVDVAPARIAYWEKSEKRSDVAVMKLDFSKDMEWYIADRAINTVTIVSPETAGMEILVIRNLMTVPGLNPAIGAL